MEVVINRKKPEVITKGKSRSATPLALIFGTQGVLDILSMTVHLSHQNGGISTCRRLFCKRTVEGFASSCCFT